MQSQMQFVPAICCLITPTWCATELYVTSRRRCGDSCGSMHRVLEHVRALKKDLVVTLFLKKSHNEVLFQVTGDHQAAAVSESATAAMDRLQQTTALQLLPANVQRTRPHIVENNACCSPP